VPDETAHRDGSRRILGLDLLRAIAVLLMVEQHMGVWLWEGPAAGETRGDYPLFVALSVLGGGAAPLFIMLAGMGGALFVAKRGADADGVIFRRGLALLGFGYLLNLTAPSWFTWRSWFVLHLMGLGLMMVPLFRRLSNRALLAVGLAIVAAMVGVQTWLDTPDHLRNARLAGWAGQPGGETLPWAPLRLALAEGQFPVLPWLAMFIAGFVAGRWVRAGETRKILTTGCIALISGFALVGASYAGLIDAPRVTHINVPFYPMTVALVALLGGLVIIGVWAALRFEERRDYRPDNPLVVLGSASLTLLIVHVWIFREGAHVLGVYKSFSPAITLATIVGFIVLSMVLAKQWRKIGFRFGAEWLLRVAGR